jgi:hypothetical protein
MQQIEATTTLEEWVDVYAVAKHIGFCVRVVTRMMKSGQIPGHAFRNGKRVFYRYRLSEVDEAIKEGRTAIPVSDDESAKVLG